MMTNQTPKTSAGTRVAPAKPGKPGKPAAPQKPKKPMPRFMIAVFTALVFLVLLGGTVYCLYTNLGGMAEQAMVLLPQYRRSVSTLQKQQAEFKTQQEKQQAERDKLTGDLKALNQKNDDLKAREDKLAADQQAFEARQQQAKTDEERRQAVVEVYNTVEVSVAAAMLDKAGTLREAADILNLLPTERVAAILSAMDPKKAYELTKLMLQ